MRSRVLMPVLCLLVLLSPGCGLLRKPDLTQMSGIARIRKPPRPVILVPGFLGSKLRDTETGRIAWGRMSNVLLGGGRDDLALSLGAPDEARHGGELEAFEIYDSLWGREYYSEILRALETAGGYQIGDIDKPRPSDTAFVFAYDWRRDNVESAAKLGRTIERLKAALGQPDLRFDLLAHSQGGLIARYYVKYGGVDLPEDGSTPIPNMSGARHVNKVIMMGTPNRGCLEALKVLHEGVKKVFRPIRPEIVFTMPSVYQMLPPRGSLLFSDVDGGALSVDLYDPRVWVEEQWSAFDPGAQKRLGKKARRAGGTLEETNRRHLDFLERALTRAIHFRAALDAPEPEPGASYYAFGSDCISTLKTAVLIEREGHREILFDEKRLKGSDIDTQRVARTLYGAGDGTVLMESLLGLQEGDTGPEIGSNVDFDSAFFVCENHGVLPNNPIFQNNLFYVLLWEGEGVIR